MKRISFLLIMVMTLTIANAQDISDGLRYSTVKISGSARYNALSGAMGALGADLSAMRINPAGSAVFLKSNVAVSFTLFDVENEAGYFNSFTKSIDSKVDLNHAGGVFVFNNSNEESIWRKFTIGLNYDNTNNFDDELFIIGTGNSSIGEFFLSQAQGIPLNLLELQPGESISDLYSFLGENEGTAAQNAFLGYQAFLFDPLVPNDPSNTQYLSNIAGGSFDQEYASLQRGYNGKFTLNFATQVKDQFFFGINLNSHTIDFQKSTFLFETNSNAGSTVNQVGFENNLAVLGSGFSAQVGAIAKVADNFRFGLTLDSPTYYEISEETTQYLESERTVGGQTTTEIINPRVLNIHENYNLKTPGKFAASAAYIFGQKGLISFDYSYKDYSQTKFSPTNDAYFSNLNNAIENALKGASAFRAGAEYRIKQLSLRGGFHYEESPYENGETVGNLQGFSLGGGYNFGNYTFDLAYSRSEQSRNQQLYAVGLTDVSNIDTVYSNLAFTLGFNF